MNFRQCSSLTCFFYFFISLQVSALDFGNNYDIDFYSILGVTKKSSIKEIKEAYKYETKKWHPELNPSEDASYRFYLINEAYKTLSDPEKKSLYEVFDKGDSELNIFFKEEDDLSGDGFHLVTTQFMQSTSTSLWIVSTKYFDKIVKPESFRHPFILFVQSERCEHCKELMANWMDWCHELALEGIKCGQIIAEDERWLLRRLDSPGINGCALVGILEGKATWSVNVSSTLLELRHFVGSLFSHKFLPELDSNNYLEYLETNREVRNHVSFLLFTNSMIPPLAYYTSIFHARSHVSGAYVYNKNPDSVSLVEKFNISSEKPTLLVFKENPSNPSFKLSTKSFKKGHFDQIIMKHNLLQTPRISCPLMFDLICPPDTPKARKRLCVILLTSKDMRFSKHLESFKRFSEDYVHSDRVKFSYVFEETQKNFVQLVTWGKEIYNSSTDTLKVLIAWHKDSKTLNFEFLEDGWHSSNNHRPRRKLVQLLEWLLNSPSTLSNFVELRKEINNEHLKTLWRRIFVRLREWYDGSIDFLLGVDNATYLTAFKSLVIVMVVGFGIRHLAVREVQMIEGTGEMGLHNSPKKHVMPEKPIIYIHMLGPDNYKSLLTESPATVRLIVLLVDTSSKNRLIKYFGAFLQPYARSKAFKFAFVNLDEHFQWYVELLDSTMKQSEHYQALKKHFGSINIKNCLGTVLAINGMKKYYFMYHISSFKAFPTSNSKDGESDDDDHDCGIKDIASEECSIGFSQSSGLVKRRNKGGGAKECKSEGRAFTEAEKLFEFDLLRGLGIWLEKLCQGKLKKFKINQWPRIAASYSK